MINQDQNRAHYFNGGFIINSYQFRSRIGKLIEDYICKKYNLYYNNRQRTAGHYDAYDKNGVYEIKASYIKSNRFVINRDNHKKLENINGDYIFVLYELWDKDKGLRVISDIKIVDIIIMNSKLLTELINQKNVSGYVKRIEKQYVRIYLSEIRELNDGL